MITHEQAKYIILNASAEFIEECSDADGKGTYICDYVHFRNSYVYDKIKPYFDKLETYITQQEKLDIFLKKNLELLGLYREIGKIPFTKNDLTLSLYHKIKVLETELKVVES